jgi:hypothetical protein
MALTNRVRKWESIGVPAPPESWFDKVEPWFDRILECLEVALVLVLALAILVATVYEVTWIARGYQSDSQVRLAAALKALNENWKAELLLLVPLFYRTIRGFLERVEEFAGAKAPRRPKSTSPETPNPPEVTPQQTKPASQPRNDAEQG